MASSYQDRVTGIDLTQEYIDTGNAISAWLNLDKLVTLLQGSVLAMPLAVASSTVAICLLFREGPVAYTVPWADDAGSSILATPEQYG